MFMGNISFAGVWPLLIMVASWRRMAAWIWVIGSGDGLLPDDTKPLPEKWLLIFNEEHWHLAEGNSRHCSRYHSRESGWKLLLHLRGANKSNDSMCSFYPYLITALMRLVAHTRVIGCSAGRHEISNIWKHRPNIGSIGLTTWTCFINQTTMIPQ